VTGEAGELVGFADGGIEIEVYPAVGARLHRLRAYGHDLLRTPWDLRPHLDDPYFYGSYPMAPWCNRVAAGRSVVAGRTIDLPASFPDDTAIHGQVSRRPWEDAGDGRFVIAGGDDGWPWPYEVEQAFAIAGGALELAIRLTNRSDEPMPGGVGFHPWFRAPLRVAIAGASVHASNLATAPLPVAVSGEHDRRRLETMPDGLDATWTDLGEPPVVLDWPDVRIRATMTVTAPTRFIVAASPAGSDAVAVEPQTHAPDGIRRLRNGEPGGLALLEPGSTLELVMRLAFERTADNGDRGPER
jgi:aldose 1-epimerase